MAGYVMPISGDIDEPRLPARQTPHRATDALKRPILRQRGQLNCREAFAMAVQAPHPDALKSASDPFSRCALWIDLASALHRLRRADGSAGGQHGERSFDDIDGAEELQVRHSSRQNLFYQYPTSASTVRVSITKQRGQRHVNRPVIPWGIDPGRDRGTIVCVVAPNLEVAIYGQSQRTD